jgi:hypothetical protein
MGAGRATAGAGQPVIVVGTRLTPEEQRRRASAFVRRTGVANGQRPAARWVDPICPLALGLSPALARQVEGKVRQIAREVGAKVAAKPCTTNIAISFVSDGSAMTRAVARSKPRNLAEVAREDRAALLDGEAPVRWWYATDLQGTDGRRSTADMSAALLGAIEGGGGLPSDERASFLARTGSSVISTQVVRVLKTATVVVDANRAAGQTLNAVATYAAFVALAEIGPSAPPEGSILQLFATPGNGDARLTSSDEAFLRALYRLPLDRTAQQQRGLLVGHMLGPAPTPRE